MSATSKSPRRVLKTAYAMAQGALPACSRHFSPKKFTQHQRLDQTLVAAAELKILKKRLRLTAIDAMLDAAARRRIETLLADAGYDGEWVHEFLRDELDIRSIIPPTIGRPTAKLPKGRYRRLMARYFERPPEARRYGQRWQVETVFSMIKRRLGETVSARSYHRQNRALLLKAIAHNVLILLWLMRFSTEHT